MPRLSATQGLRSMLVDYGASSASEKFLERGPRLSQSSDQRSSLGSGARILELGSNTNFTVILVHGWDRF